MNDTEVLTWVAEHLEHLEIGVNRVDITWIDDKGYSKKFSREIDANEDNTEILRHCVTALAAP